MMTIERGPPNKPMKNDMTPAAHTSEAKRPTVFDILVELLIS